MTQSQFTSVGGAFASIIFEPCNPARPMQHMNSAAGPGLNEYLPVTQIFCPWKDKDGVGVTYINRQPEGWDTWFDQTQVSAYRNATVLGTKITITAVPGTSQSTPARFICGFNDVQAGGLYDKHTTSSAKGLPSFVNTYNNFSNVEVASALGSTVLGKHPKPLVLAGTGSHLEPTQSWTFTYSQYKMLRWLKRNGKNAPPGEDLTFQSNLAPAYNPFCVFTIADVGASSTKSFNVFLTFEYTIKLSERRIANQSVY